MGNLSSRTRLTINGKLRWFNIPVTIKVDKMLLEDVLGKATNKIVATDITKLDGKQIESLQAGDMVIKRDSSGDHSYRVSFRSATGICLTYSDCENVETVAYDKVEGVWTYDSTDVTNIGS